MTYDLGVFMFKAMNNTTPEVHICSLDRTNINKGQMAVSYAGAEFWNEI